MLDQYQKLGDTVFAILSLDVNDINLQQKQKCESLSAMARVIPTFPLIDEKG